MKLRGIIFAAAGAALITYYAYLVTLGEFTFVAPSQWGLTFNSQWQHLIHGQFDVDPAVTNEVFIINGKAYIYWGIFPALIRGLLSPLIDLSLPAGRASIFLAVLVLMASLLGTALSLGLHWGKTRRFFWPLFFALLLGNTYLTILVPSNPYHECIIWGAANLSLFNLLLMRFALDPYTHTIRKLIFMGLAAAGALLSRVPEGTCAFTALAIIGVALALRHFGASQKTFGQFPKMSFRGLSIVAAVWFLAASIHLFINYERFGSPFETQPVDKISYLPPTNIRAVNLKKFGLWQWDRMPVAFEYFFVPHRDNFSSRFPFFVMSNTLETKPFALNIDWIEPRSGMPLTLTGLFFVVFSVLGIRCLWSKKPGVPDATREILVAGAIGNFMIVIIMFGFAGFTYRYGADIVTLLVYLTFVAFYHLKSESGRRIISEKRLFRASIVLAALSVYVSLATYCVYIVKNPDFDLRRKEALYNRFLKPFRGVDYYDDSNDLKW